VIDLVRVWAVFRKETIHVRRDPASLIQIILMPVMLLLLYGYALTFDIKHVPTAVLDREGSQVSRDFVRRFEASRYFSLRYFVSGYPEIERLIDTRTVRLALVIPHDFSRTIKSGRTARVQAIVDGTDANTANIVLGYVQGVAAAYGQGLVVDRLRLRGLARQEMPVRSEPRVWFNEDLESRNYIVPGLIVVIMTMVGALLTALCVVREAERGSMEGLMATPLKKPELILGKLGPYFIIGMVDLAIAVLMGQFLFQVPLRGSVALLIATSALFLIVMLGQGLLISVAATNQLIANQMAMLTTFLPSFLLSGFVFAIKQMPWWLQAASYLVPARYFVTISKGIYLKGVGLAVLWPDVVVLIGFAALFLIAADRKFVKKIR
jgi:ABC-2 type transport system permease protein